MADKKPSKISKTSVQPSKKLTTFIYQFKEINGFIKKDEIQALTLVAAKTTLRQQGIVPIKIEKKSPFANLFSNEPRTQSIGSMDIALFTRQMATMGRAGLPLVQAFTVVAESTEHSGIRSLSNSIKLEIESGSSFSQALRKNPRHFDNLYCSLVEAGENSGSLDIMLDRIAIYKEKTETLKRKIKKALFYPAAVVSVAILVSLILLLKVVPTFKDLFKGFGAELPGFTLFVLTISDAIIKYWYFVLGFIIFLILLYYFSLRDNINFINFMQKFSLKLPVFGKILKKTIIARFARTLATTFSAGVPLADALEAIAKASNNIVYYVAIMEVKNNVTGGQPLKLSMKKSGVFPPIIIQMVGIGEETGALDDMLAKVALIFEEEVDGAVDSLTSLLEPLIMVFLGVVVGGLVIAMYLPIFKMGSVV